MQESVYKKILNNIQDDGRLPAGFSLWGLEASRDPYALDGARDAVLLFHERKKKLEPEAFFEAFSLLAENNFTKAFALLADLFAKHSVVRALPILGESLDGLALSQNPYPLLNQLIRLLRESADPEMLKFALLSLEYVSLERLPEVKEIIKTLALSDELTFFASLAAGNWPESEAVLQSFAEKARGWGRIMMVPRLNIQNRAVNLWLLDEGQFNDARPEYNATVILSRSLLPGLLRDPDLSEDRFRKLSRLLLASLRPEPMLVTFEDLAPEFEFALIEQWLKAALNFRLTATECEIILRLDDYLQYILMNLEDEFLPEDLEDENFVRLPEPDIFLPFQDDIRRLAVQTESFIDIPLFSNIIVRERGELGLIQIRELMGLKASPEEALELLQNDPADNLPAIRFLAEHPFYFRRMLKYFSERLPLNALAAGPEAFRADPRLSDDEKILIEILTAMRYKPWEGKEFMLTGLQSSHPSCRLSALVTLQIWMFHTAVPLKSYDEALFGLLSVLSRFETCGPNRYYLYEISLMHVRRY